MKKLKIKCLTPKGKAEASEKSLRNSFFKAAGRVTETNIVSDSEFYWIVEVEDDKKVPDLMKRIARADFTQKQFYRIYIRFVSHANKLMNKSGWAARKVKNWLLKEWQRYYRDQPFPDAIQQMDDNKFIEYLTIDNKDEFIEFLKQDLITVEEVI